jgi:heme/copper-type cytochrome/quinol oxidase subunit 3
MHALPAAPAPPPRRQVLVGTALAGAGTLMLIGGMLAVWYQQRSRAHDAGEPWLPEGITIPEVPTNVMLFGLVGLVLFAQWAVHATRRQDRINAGLALGLVALMALAVINAQVYVFNQMHLPLADEMAGYAGMFYAVTGTMTALFGAGLVFTLITAFRVLGGRVRDHELVVAHALYWYVLTAAFAAVWFVVYVTK